MTDGDSPSTDADTDVDLDASGDIAADEPALDELLAALEADLRATEELPVDPGASVWLGEAHAVVADLAGDDVAAGVVHERVGHVHHLLTNAGDVENEAVQERVTHALGLVELIRDRTGDATDDD